jgi:hypothetical protein
VTDAKQPKLTPAQLVFLRDCASQRRYVSESYTPANRLIASGYLRSCFTINPGRLLLEITDAGKDRLKAEEQAALERNSK